jgi:hypothetical protein
MSIIDQGMGFLQTTIGMVSAAILIGGAGLVFYMYKFGDVASKGTVILFRPKDKRAEFVPVLREEENLIRCKPKDGIARRFFKGGHGWVINKKNYFLAVEGSGYTAVLNKAENRELPIVDYLRDVWGEYFNKISENRLRQISNPSWVVSIEPTKVDIDGSGLPRISSEDLNDKEDSLVLDKLAKSVEASKPKTDWIMLALAAGSGAGIVLLIKALGWLKF